MIYTFRLAVSSVDINREDVIDGGCLDQVHHVFECLFHELSTGSCSCEYNRKVLYSILDNVLVILQKLDETTFIYTESDPTKPQVVIT
ncbi:hypothetical protein ATCV1_z007L [Acanthocystis turfacea chlorella virus 1]|uniref:Uncharacterized protein z007L n=1 Tax=Chlorovirus heliozoae TaxID=322019 RepID=A7K7W7_9PHYC|nr:hypothetical protein ATCV1_z007L [Acanthocystis turfacea chlorella virus 1]ABT16141.1 hypothetical protein ATCV1_z007L [Acanthocystis turfacea chlorella virus 1]